MHPWSAFVLTLISLVALSFHTQIAQAEQDAFNTVRYKDANANFSGESFCFDQNQPDLTGHAKYSYRDLLSNTSDWQLAPNVNLTLYSQPNYE